MCRLPSCSFRPERSSNVAGRPKGQGQTAETLLDRRKKETNKSRVANHNRRSMADRKRNKGMIPSWPVAQAQWTDGRRGGWGVREWKLKDPGSGVVLVQVQPKVTVKAVTDFVSFQNGFGKTAFWLFLLLKVANKLYWTSWEICRVWAQRILFYSSINIKCEGLTIKNNM